MNRQVVYMRSIDTTFQISSKQQKQKFPNVGIPRKIFQKGRSGTEKKSMSVSLRGVLRFFTSGDPGE